MESESATARATASSAILERYRDAYGVGAALVAVGNVVKVFGAILTCIIVVAAIAAIGSLGQGALVSGITVAVIVGGLIWINAVIVTAQGQILRATLDTAVSNSPFLDDKQRLRAMGLSQESAAAGVEDAMNLSAEKRAAERAQGIIRCKYCDKRITASDHQICRDKELCEAHV